MKYAPVQHAEMYIPSYWHPPKDPEKVKLLAKATAAIRRGEDIPEELKRLIQEVTTRSTV